MCKYTYAYICDCILEIARSAFTNDFLLMLLNHEGAFHGPGGALIGLHVYQTAPHSSLGLPCGLYQFMSHTEGTALLFKFEWLL